MSAASSLPAPPPADLARAVLLAALRGTPLPDLQGLDWPALVEQAIGDGVLLLLSQTELMPRLPPAVERQLKLRLVANARSSQDALDELARLAKAFSAAGVRLLVAKGPILAAQAHGHPGLRGFSDLDLFVAPEDVEAAEALLTHQGYAPEVPTTARQERLLRRFNKERVFRQQDLGLPADLHWGFGGPDFPFPLPFPEAWDQHVPFLAAAGPISTLGPVHSLLYAAFHSAKHAWYRLEQLAALARLARAPLDWPAVDALAGRLHVQKALGLSFLLAEHTLGTPPPPVPLALATSRRGFPAVARLVEANHRLGPARRDGLPISQSRLLLDRRRDFLRSLAVACCVPTYTDWAALTLPPALDWLYWPLRPARLALKYARRALPRPRLTG